MLILAKSTVSLSDPVGIAFCPGVFKEWRGHPSVWLDIEAADDLGE